MPVYFHTKESHMTALASLRDLPAKDGLPQVCTTNIDIDPVVTLLLSK